MGLFNKKFRLVVLVSGRGSNLEAIILAIKSGTLKNVEIALVISDNPDAKALEMSRKYGIKAEYLSPGSFKTKLEGDAEANYIKRINQSKPDLIVLAGFMRIIKPGFIKSFPNKIINIHPSLLPKYPGLHTHQRALEAGDKMAGCTIHFVNEITDGGKRILQARVPILPGDTEDTLAKRVLEKEHIALPYVIGLFARNKLDYETLPDEPAFLDKISA